MAIQPENMSISLRTCSIQPHLLLIKVYDGSRFICGNSAVVYTEYMYIGNGRKINDRCRYPGGVWQWIFEKGDMLYFHFIIFCSFPLS